MTKENPYIVPVKPEKDDYSTVKGDSRHWAGGKYTEYAALLADYEGQLEKHRLWHEGHQSRDNEVALAVISIATLQNEVKSQAEIVSELVEACRKAWILSHNPEVERLLNAAIAKAVGE